MPRDNSQRLTTALACIAALLMLSQLLAGKATRDSLFLSYFDASSLPLAMMAGGILSLVSAIPAARAMARFGPARLVPWLFAASGGLFLVEWLFITHSPRPVAVALYLHLAAATAVIISGFWSTVNERFDPHSAKRSLAQISSWATLGGLLGGLLSERVTTWFGIEAVLIVMSGMHLTCAVVVSAIGSPPGRSLAEAGHDDAEGSPLSIIRNTPYLRMMVSVGFLVAVMDALLDYALKAEAAAALHGSQELIRFFGVFYTGVGLATFVMQAAFARRLLGRFGIGPVMSLLPITVGVTAALCGVVTHLWSVVLMRASGSVLSNSLYRTGFELLYTPLPPRTKRPTKVFVDVGGQRLGDIAGGALVMALIAVLPGASILGVSLFAVLVCSGIALVLSRLQRAYTVQLATNLQSGEISLESMDPLARNIAETQISLDRSEILARIHEVRAQRQEPVSNPAERAAEPEELIAWLGDSGRVAEASARLRAMGSEAAPALLGALADHALPQLVRLLLPGLLAGSPSLEVARGLVAGLADERFEVRVRCARVAARMVIDHPDWRLERDAVIEAVRSELARDRGIRGRSTPTAGDDRSDSALLADQPNASVNRTAEHVFTILSLHFDAELMTSVLLGLHSASSQARGTALEYVDVTLPEDLRRELQTFLGGSANPGARGPKPGPASKSSG